MTRSLTRRLTQAQDYSINSKSSFAAPHMGQTQSSGRSANLVPAAMPQTIHSYCAIFVSPVFGSLEINPLYSTLLIRVKNLDL
jgi:hypothetical protein